MTPSEASTPPSSPGTPRRFKRIQSCYCIQNSIVSDDSSSMSSSPPTRGLLFGFQRFETVSTTSSSRRMAATTTTALSPTLTPSTPTMPTKKNNAHDDALLFNDMSLPPW